MPIPGILVNGMEGLVNGKLWSNWVLKNPGFKAEVRAVLDYQLIRIDLKLFCLFFSGVRE